jgi:hypothetical protein
MTDDRLALRVKDFCARVGISPATFWKYTRLEKIHTIRIGGRVLVPMTEVNRILNHGII